MKFEQINSWSGRLISGAIVLLSILAVSVFIMFSLWANDDMRAGRHVLFMDELITYDSAMAFLQVESLKDLFYAFADSDGRYGATLYYSSALVAVLGNAFGGDAGAILLIRMLLSVELAAAYLLLAFVLISNRLLSLVALLTLIFLPTTAYFATMPKPEPLQLLFLAIFLYLFVKRRQFFGWPWLFFGLASAGLGFGWFRVGFGFFGICRFAWVLGLGSALSLMNVLQLATSYFS